jgi:hypothetical protein
MLGHGDDAAHCSNGLSAQRYRAATVEERNIYRKWIRGTVVFYGLLFLISGAAVIVSYLNTSPTRLITLSNHPAAASARTN